uniref:Histone-lysine N-methyltransferase n=1 Tax=Spongospora subterranea TaxID=70186 RepID=A0A0H5R7G9_9EUKA|eukprot:CRZ09761.1 hypothetical protein [Spongospora subterranea]
MERFLTDQRGWGLRARQAIPAHRFVAEYRGELISVAECDRRRKQCYELGVFDTYMLSVTGDMIIDARHSSGEGRFINHSCNPNCVVQKWTDGPHIRIAIMTGHNIPCGQELTIDYAFYDSRSQIRQKCLCGSANCRKVIDYDRNDPKNDNDDLRHILADDECFECGDGGNLVLCSYSQPGFVCHRAFHPKCVGLGHSPPAHTLYQCPCHLCDVCRNSPVQVQCITCVSAWCRRHCPSYMKPANQSKNAPTVYRLCPSCAQDDVFDYLSSEPFRHLLSDREAYSGVFISFPFDQDYVL